MGQLLREVGRGERDLETSRRILAENENFEPYSAFIHLSGSSNTNGFFGLPELQDFARRYDFQITDEEADQLLRTWDSSGDGSVSYGDFIEAVLPVNDRALKAVVQGRVYDENKKVDFEVEHLLSRLIDRELGTIKKVQVLSSQLNSGDFNIYDAFHEINDKGVVNANDIRRFLRRVTLAFSEEDISALMRRIDKNRDGNVSYMEFSAAVLPSRSLFVNATVQPLSYDKAPPVRPTPTYNPTLERPSTPPSRAPGSPKKFSSPSKQAAYDRVVAQFNDQIRLFKILEGARQGLALCPDFSLKSGFSKLDTSSKGYASVNDFETFFRENGLSVSAQQMYLIFRHYNHDSSGRIRYQDFVNMFQPKNAEHAAGMQINAANEISTADTQQKFGQAMKLLAEVEEAAENLRLKLRRNTVDIHELFKGLDTNRDGFITQTELQNILGEYNIQASEQEVKNLIELYDSNHDGRVDLSELTLGIKHNT